MSIMESILNFQTYSGWITWWTVSGYATAFVYFVLALFGGKWAEGKEREGNLITFCFCLMVPPLVWLACLIFFLAELLERIMLYWSRRTGW